MNEPQVATDFRPQNEEAIHANATYKPFDRNSASIGEAGSILPRHRDRPTSGSRFGRHASLLRDATREFSLLKRPETSEVDRYKELFYQLIDRLEKGDRRLISAMLARSNFTPRPVALYLAQDAIEVAAPFLLFSPVLNDLDLRAIASKKGRLYADIIKKRKLPMEPFTEQQLSKASPETAPDTTHGNAGASETVHSEKPQKPMRDAILELAGRGGRTGRAGSATVNATEPSKPAPVRQNFTLPDEHSQSRNTGLFRLPKKDVRCLLSLGRRGNLTEIATRIEAWCGLPSADCLKLLTGSKAEEPLYLLKALGIAAPHDIQLAMLIVPSTGRSIANYRSAKKTLAELDQGICQIIFNEIGAKFDLMRDGAALATPKETVVEPAGKPETFHDAMLQRRQAVQTRYQGDDRFAGGLADRWPGASPIKPDIAIPMAG